MRSDKEWADGFKTPLGKWREAAYCAECQGETRQELTTGDNEIFQECLECGDLTIINI